MTQPTANASTQQWATTPGKAIEPTRGAALVAVSLAGVVAVMALVQAALAFPVGEALAAGDDPDIARSSAVLTFEAFGVAFGVAVTVVWVATCVWLARARRNSEAISTMRHDRSRVWVWLGWVVPVVSLWFPRQVVRDIHRASHPEHTLPARLDLWWGLWLVSVLASNVADRVSLSGDLQYADMLGPFHLVAAVTMVAALVPWVLIVRRIVALQESAAVGGASLPTS